MNVLLIEDEKELAATARLQIEALGHSVDLVYDLAGARERMDAPDQKIAVVIADHRLPDGPGIEWVIEMRKTYPDCEYVIVSGCLTAADIRRLEERELPYFHKPLLYSKVIEQVRRRMVSGKPVHEPPSGSHGSQPAEGEGPETNETTDGHAGVLPSGPVRSGRGFLGRLRRGR